MYVVVQCETSRSGHLTTSSVDEFDACRMRLRSRAEMDDGILEESLTDLFQKLTSVSVQACESRCHVDDAAVCPIQRHLHFNTNVDRSH